MITSIEEVIAERADLAPAAKDVMASILEEYGDGRARNRAPLAIAGSALAVAAVSAVAVAGPWHHDDSRPAQPGGRPIVTSAPPPSSPRVRPTPHAPAPKRLRLVDAVPAPASAPESLGRVPAGWAYLTKQGPVTAYAPVGTRPTMDESTQLTVFVMSGTSGKYPLRIGNRPGRVTESDGLMLAFVKYGRNELRLQIPRSTGISRSQLIELAASATVRAGAPAGQ